MELSGKVVKILDEQSGQGQNGTWRKQEVIVETEGQYPKKVCIAVWGDKIDQFNLQENDLINAHINIESREYNGRWYTDVKAWRIDKQQGGQPSDDFIADSGQGSDFPPPSAPMPDEDDLPF